MMRKKLMVLLMACSLALLAASCGEAPPPEGKPIAKINDYLIGSDRFREILAESAKYGDIQALSLKDKQQRLDREIDKVLLIQEAVSHNLHREESFRKAVERYWEQTLITNLIRQKMAATKGQVIVTEDEVKAAYEQRVQADPNTPPLAQIRDQLEKQLLEAKKTKAVDNWILQLRKGAHIKIYQDNLRDLR